MNFTSLDDRHMSLSDTVARNIRLQRRRRHLSQEAVARRAGLSTSYLSMLERGQRSPPLDTLEDIADALHVEPISLLSDERD